MRGGQRSLSLRNAPVVRYTSDHTMTIGKWMMFRAQQRTNTNKMKILSKGKGREGRHSIVQMKIRISSDLNHLLETDFSKVLFSQKPYTCCIFFNTLKKALHPIFKKNTVGSRTREH